MSAPARVLALTALVACGAYAQDVPLPNTPPGFRVGSGPVVIEGFMDLLVRGSCTMVCGKGKRERVTNCGAVFPAAR